MKTITLPLEEYNNLISFKENIEKGNAMHEVLFNGSALFGIKQRIYYVSQEDSVKIIEANIRMLEEKIKSLEEQLKAEKEKTWFQKLLLNPLNKLI